MKRIGSIPKATATENLDTFNLDFAAYEIQSVTVDGEAAEHELIDEELVIDPDPLLAADTEFVVEVRYRGRPRSVPGAGFGIAGHVGMTVSELWPIELGFLGLFPTTRDADDGTRGSARFGLLLGSLAACPAQAGETVQLRLCLGAELGRLHVQTEGFAVDGPAVNDLVANALATVVLRVPLGRGRCRCGGGRLAFRCRFFIRQRWWIVGSCGRCRGRIGFGWIVHQCVSA